MLHILFKKCTLYSKVSESTRLIFKTSWSCTSKYVIYTKKVYIVPSWIPLKLKSLVALQVKHMMVVKFCVLYSLGAKFQLVLLVTIYFARSPFLLPATEALPHLFICLMPCFLHRILLLYCVPYILFLLMWQFCKIINAQNCIFSARCFI